jgi:hypothetical protein
MIVTIATTLIGWRAEVPFALAHPTRDPLNDLSIWRRWFIANLAASSDAG